MTLQLCFWNKRICLLKQIKPKEYLQVILCLVVRNYDKYTERNIKRDYSREELNYSRIREWLLKLANILDVIFSYIWKVWYCRSNKWNYYYKYNISYVIYNYISRRSAETKKWVVYYVWINYNVNNIFFSFEFLLYCCSLIFLFVIFIDYFLLKIQT